MNTEQFEVWNETSERKVIILSSPEELTKWIQKQKDTFGDICPNYKLYKATTTREEITA